MKLNITSSGVKYYLHFDVYQKVLYISLPNEKIVVMMRPGVDEQNNRFDFPGGSQLYHSQTTIAGRVGRRCIGNKVCGDGGLATHALLAYPKVKTMTLQMKRYL